MSEESRYSRQILLPQIGEQGQKRLAESTAAVIGCGGLGAPVLTSLALAGVGKLRLIDHDRIGLSNLNRQFLYEESELDKEKCERAADFLRRRNSGIVLETVCERLTEENARRLLSGVDVIVDCVDRVETRRHAGRAARRLSVPLVEGGVHGFYGFVLSVLPGKSACLECVTAQEAEER